MQLARMVKRWLARQLAPCMEEALIETAQAKQGKALEMGAGKSAMNLRELVDGLLADRDVLQSVRLALREPMPHLGLAATLDPSAVIYGSAWINNPRGDRSAITVGANSHVRGELFVAWKSGSICIGDWCHVGDSSHIWSHASVTIGNHVLVSHGVDIHDTDSHPKDWQERRLDAEGILTGNYRLPTQTVSKPVIIEDDVWIGAKATILKGVRVGKGAIIGAGAVVTRDVAPFAIVAGNPARTIFPAASPPLPVSDCASLTPDSS
jgi:acetyltransferase-like isoleucine patch superfamily enzyme